ncbi:RmlC-like cupin domain-containing protein [Crassisporium funariophilum]|nr:RmlC-like cupin domain-containing protein [Crassisporium funariophilum]
MWRKAILLSVLLQSIKSVLPAATPLQPDVPFTDSDPNEELWTPTSGIHPRPERGSLGASILGPQNIPIELQNADLLAPPTTDQGSIKNFKWPFSSSHNKLKDGGWARQQNINDMPLATDIAGVNMRLEAGAIREMHWHATAEWAYVLKGDIRISTITPEGQVWVGDVSAGDLWYFPAGNPHSIQAKDTTPDGAEFILIFDEGDFSEDATFLLTDWLAHVPKSVLAKNFGMDGNLQAFDHIPEHELYIFPSQPPPDDINKDMVVPNNTPHPFTFQFSKVAPTKKIGGTVKIVDTRTFTVSEKISAAEVEVEVGGMRELHWHPTQPEWTFFICGEARITLFASQSNAATYDFYPGDIAYIPPSFGHYIENTGNTTLRFIEILKTNLFQDISLTQWLALTPPELVKAHLGFSDETIARLSKTKQTLVV